MFRSLTAWLPRSGPATPNPVPMRTRRSRRLNWVLGVDYGDERRSDTGLVDQSRDREGASIMESDRDGFTSRRRFGRVAGAGDRGGDFEHLTSRTSRPAAPNGVLWVRRGATSVAMPRGLIGLTITLGLKDEHRPPGTAKSPSPRGGCSALMSSRAPHASSEGSKFKVATKKKAAAKRRPPPRRKKASAGRKAAAATIPAVIYVNLEAPETATVTVRSRPGDVLVQAGGPEYGPGGTCSLTIRRLSSSRRPRFRLTGVGTEDDSPPPPGPPTAPPGWRMSNTSPRSTADQGGGEERLRSAVPSKNGDRIRLTAFDGTTWSPGMDVTGGGPRRLAADRRGRRPGESLGRLGSTGRWRLGDLLTGFTPPGAGRGAGSWAAPERLTHAKGSDFHVVAATDSRGRVWLAWQAFRGDNYEILAVHLPSDWNPRPRPPSVVSVSPADDWAPAIVADGKGGVFVAWDTYDKGNFDVMIRDVGRAGQPVAVASRPG